MNLSYFSEIIERVTNALLIIDSDHAYIHEGHLYETSTQFTLATGSTRYISFTTPETIYIHYRPAAIVTSADKLTFELLESGTFTAGTGTALTPYNHNRITTKTAAALVRDNVTATADGTSIYKGYIGGGTGVGQARSGDQRGEKNEWVLKRNAVYMIKLTNGSTESNIININNLWYEQDGA